MAISQAAGGGAQIKVPLSIIGKEWLSNRLDHPAMSCPRSYQSPGDIMWCHVFCFWSRFLSNPLTSTLFQELISEKE